MKTTAMLAVLGLTLAGAGALAFSPGDSAEPPVDEARVQQVTEARLRQVFEGLLASERANPHGAPRARR